MKLSAIIVDDEFPARAELKSILEEIGNIDIVGECEDGDEALELINHCSPDVVFLDIRMRNKDGLVTAGEIMEMQYPPFVVFTTGYNQFAAQAFDLNAVDYILKPYSSERVAKSIDKLAKVKENHKSTGAVAEPKVPGKQYLPNLCIWFKDRMVVIRPSEILFAKADQQRQTLLQTERGIMHTKIPLKELEAILGEQGFLRTHKSYLVNLEKVREIIPWFNNTYVLTLENCQETNIPVARHYMKEFNAHMGIVQ